MSEFNICDIALYYWFDHSTVLYSRVLYYTHNWFISVVDSNELGTVQPVHVNQSKYEGHENEGAVGAMMVFFLA